MSEAYVLYRLPHADEYTILRQTSGNQIEYGSCKDLTGKHGFVFAPFAISEKTPVLLLNPDEIEHKRIDGNTNIANNDYETETRNTDNERSVYKNDFCLFHEKLKDGHFSKIVLSRCSEEKMTEKLCNEELFLRACNLYPRMFIALISMSKSGTWLMATPEILLENIGGNKWQTIALAGTMKLQGHLLDFDIPGCSIESNEINWSNKNIKEQQYVASYLKERLSRFTDDITEEGPYTARAGNLVHLRSNFSFTLNTDTMLGELINELHPTPAVCGIPKAETYDYIRKNESNQRDYYSGFAGILGVNGNTHLYVTLRCMQIEDNRCRLYAGGGLLDDSDEEQEWAETEAKMETMRRCIAIKKT